MLVQALHLGNKSTPDTPGKDEEGRLTRSGKLQDLMYSNYTKIICTESPAVSIPGTPKEDTSSPSAFAITNDQDLANTNGDVTMSGDDGPSAADYDPTMDMKEDRHRDGQRHNEEAPSGSYNETKQSIEQDVLPASTAPDHETSKKSKDELDMFAEEDDDDMFAEEPAEKSGNTAGKLQEPSVAVPVPEARTLDIGMLDNWDDPEGYYKIILGELLNGRYHVQSNLGQGMFSGVVRATDVTTKKLVAIKLIRNNETMQVPKPPLLR
jgi:serine/threonine-protein kinase PRP4